MIASLSADLELAGRARGEVINPRQLSRCDLLDENDKIKTEHVVFYAAQG